ncbi:MAG: hypothetical protein HYV32_00290 [Candidatus Kerfeldbacteria bacterium]|nr:hypothetical protein [Candidatus Kerfeldbacteria bacterium]
MNNAGMGKKLWKKAALVAGSAILFGLLVVGLLWLIFPHEYSSTMRILVVQKYTFTDSYTAAKNAEKISQGLSAVVHTSSFLDQVIKTGEVQLDDLAKLSEEDKRDEWKKKVSARIVPNTSILEIVAYDTNPDQATTLVQAMSTVMLTHGADYHGAGDTIELRVVDSPLTSTRPVRPNIFLYGFASALLGAIAAAVWMFLHPSSSLSVTKKITSTISTTANTLTDAAQDLTHTITDKLGSPGVFSQEFSQKQDMAMQTPAEMFRSQNQVQRQPEDQVPGGYTQPSYSNSVNSAEEYAVLHPENFTQQVDRAHERGSLNEMQPMMQTMHNHYRPAAAASAEIQSPQSNQQQQG